VSGRRASVKRGGGRGRVGERGGRTPFLQGIIYGLVPKQRPGSAGVSRRRLVPRGVRVRTKGGRGFEGEVETPLDREALGSNERRRDSTRLIKVNRTAYWCRPNLKLGGKGKRGGAGTWGRGKRMPEDSPPKRELVH